MKHITLVGPQEKNACTIISGNIIAAIGSAPNNDRAIHWATAAAHFRGQKQYLVDFNAGNEDGEGVMEEDVYKKYFSGIFFRPRREQLTESAGSIDLAQLLKNRNGYGSIEEFMGFNLEAIEVLEKQAGKPIAWHNITEKELRKLLENNKKLSSLQEQINEVIQQLQNNEGVTLRTQGHTISLIKNKNLYSFDSLTGVLSSTVNAQEMLQHVMEKFKKNKSTEVVVYHFLPVQKPLQNNPALELVQETSLTQEEIRQFIQQRPASSEGFEYFNWLEMNAVLIVRLYQQIPENTNKSMLAKRNIDWHSITAQDLFILARVSRQPTTQNNTIKAKTLITKKDIEEMIKDRDTFYEHNRQGWEQVYSETILNLLGLIPIEKLLNWNMITTEELCDLAGITPPSPRKNNALTTLSFFNNPPVCDPADITEDQKADILTHIDTLTREMQSFWAMNKARKQVKIDALEDLLQLAETKSLTTALTEIDIRYNEKGLRDGIISTRTSDLLYRLANPTGIDYQKN